MVFLSFILQALDVVFFFCLSFYKHWILCMLKDFERMNVTGYQLIKCGGYYYLSLDRARLKSLSVPNPIQHQLEDVAFKLDEMNKEYPVSDPPCSSPGEVTI